MITVMLEIVNELHTHTQRSSINIKKEKIGGNSAFKIYKD